MAFISALPPEIIILSYYSAITVKQSTDYGTASEYVSGRTIETLQPTTSSEVAAAGPPGAFIVSDLATALDRAIALITSSSIISSLERLSKTMQIPYQVKSLQTSRVVIPPAPDSATSQSLAQVGVLSTMKPKQVDETSALIAFVYGQSIQKAIEIVWRFGADRFYSLTGPSLVQVPTGDAIKEQAEVVYRAFDLYTYPHAVDSSAKAVEDVFYFYSSLGLTVEAQETVSASDVLSYRLISIDDLIKAIEITLRSSVDKAFAYDYMQLILQPLEVFKALGLVGDRYIELPAVEVALDQVSYVRKCITTVFKASEGAARIALHTGFAVEVQKCINELLSGVEDKIAEVDSLLASIAQKTYGDLITAEDYAKIVDALYTLYDVLRCVYYALILMGEHFDTRTLALLSALEGMLYEIVYVGE